MPSSYDESHVIPPGTLSPPRPRAPQDSTNSKRVKIRPLPLRNNGFEIEVASAVRSCGLHMGQRAQVNRHSEYCWPRVALYFANCAPGQLVLQKLLASGSTRNRFLWGHAEMLSPRLSLVPVAPFPGQKLVGVGELQKTVLGVPRWALK